MQDSCHPEAGPAVFAGMAVRNPLLGLLLGLPLGLSFEVGLSRLNMNRTYCVYILASRSRNLYTGVTGNLEPRMVEHRQGLVPGFTTRYRISRLVYFEFFSDVHAAIAREKEIKGWRREKKIWLIKRNNPTWADLAEKLPHQYQMTNNRP
jgi:putative endonuclease